MATKLISDISSHNPSLNAVKMKSAGVKAVIVRAGYRTHKYGKVDTDPLFLEHTKKIMKVKLPIGVYWWTQSLSNKEAIEEAEYCVKLVKDMKLSFPIFLDLEFYNSEREGRADHISSERRTEYAVTFLEKCRKLGYDAGVYCNPDFWKKNLVPSKLSAYPRWIAHYNAKSATMDCDIWQYTSTAKGSTYGVGSQFIDLSHMYTDFTSGEKSKFTKETTKTDTETKTVEKSAAPSKEEKFVGYVTANELNIRTGAGVDKSTVSFSPLKKNTAVFVCDTVKAPNGDVWYYIKYNGKFGFCSSKYIAKKDETKKESVNYLAESKKWMKIVYDKVVEVHCRHKGGVHTLEDIIAKRATTCTATITAVFVKVGLLKAGKHISHRVPVGGSAENILKKKNTIQKSMTGYENLDKTKCDVYYIGAKNWAAVPEKYKVAGAAYIQDSNGFMCQGKNKDGKWVNRSCNNSGSQVKRDKHGVPRYYNNTMTSGYTFNSPVLVAIIPKSK